MSVSDLFVQSAFSSINPAGMKYKGDWIIAGIYQKGDVVIAPDNSTYICIAPSGSTGVEPSTAPLAWTEIGGNASGSTAGSGGIGITSSISGSSVGYAGGGGNNTDLGFGGGFNGSDTNRAGKANRGGGGKGTTGPGGSGVVIVRYARSQVE
jgi:hypothetical protein